MKQSEILTAGPASSSRPWPLRRSAIALGALAVLIGIGTLALDRSDQPARTPTTPAGAASSAGAPGSAGPSSSPAAAGAFPARQGISGLLITGAAGPVSTLDRRDSTAADGPWTVVVRSPDGSLGRYGAVITFPVPAPPPGRPVTVGGRAATASERTVTWPIGGAFARIRGDLIEPELLTVAAATRVVGGRPVVQPVPGFAVIATGPLRPTFLPEARYGSTDVGESASLGEGLTYTGLLRSGGFEDALYRNSFQISGRVQGHPAVLTTAVGGNGTLAWEPAPGTVAYVGYSGSVLSPEAVAALHRLAERSRTVDVRQWQATRPSVTDQINSFD